MKPNKTYKDSVFTTLFSDKAKLLEIYNAIEGTSYGPDSEIEINTLDGVLFQDRMNDISFEIDKKYVILMEHQSTINENMPVRMLIYVARLYEKLLSDEKIYRKIRIPLSTPEFLVCYNGTEDFPLEMEMKLSDAFKAAAPENSMELKVRILNINYDKGGAILGRSKTLREYSYFIEAVRQYVRQGKPLEQAIQDAVKDCVDKNVLKEFLNQNGSEVCNMLFGEWDMEKALKVERQEGMEKGIEKGIEKGVERERQNTLRKMAERFDAKTIADIMGLPVDEVRRYVQDTPQR